MMTDATAEFDRAADEIQVALCDYPISSRIALLVELTARTMAEAEAMPDTKFLNIIQQRIIVLASEEDVSYET